MGVPAPFDGTSDCETQSVHIGLYSAAVRLCEWTSARASQGGPF